ncbi:MAG TPA: DUF5719 family protein, partial [Actinomycetota bacterium]
MRARGQGLLTVVLVGVIVALGVSFDRLGAKPPAAARPGAAQSGVWLCPHGGGPDWVATVNLANPGDAPVQARVTSMGAEGSQPSEAVVVPPGSQVRVPTPAEERGSTTYVEYFGGWVSAGWITRGASGEAGIGAEPCAPEPGRSWFSSGVSTGQDEEGYLVVMNPFATDAVFDVALFFAPPRNPVRDSELTDVTLGPGRSVAIKLNGFGEGEVAMGVGMGVSSGRVAAATTVVSEDRGIASVLASTATVRTAYLPTPAGAGQSILSLAVPTDQGSDIGALLLSKGATRPVPNLAAAALEPNSAGIFPVTPEGPTSVSVAVQEGGSIMAALRTQGPGKDDAATAGTADPATAWVVPPTVAGEPAKPGVLIVNPGDTQAIVTIRLLPIDGGGAETTMTVAPASVASVDAGFLAAEPDASVLVTAQGGSVIALGASTSSGSHADSLF